jgi:hypothetical protein
LGFGRLVVLFLPRFDGRVLDLPVPGRAVVRHWLGLWDRNQQSIESNQQGQLKAHDLTWPPPVIVWQGGFLLLAGLPSGKVATWVKPQKQENKLAKKMDEADRDIDVILATLVLKHDPQTANAMLLTVLFRLLPKSMNIQAGKTHEQFQKRMMHLLGEFFGEQPEPRPLQDGETFQFWPTEPRSKQENKLAKKTKAKQDLGWLNLEEATDLVNLGIKGFKAKRRKEITARAKLAGRSVADQKVFEEWQKQRRLEAWRKTLWPSNPA